MSNYTKATNFTAKDSLSTGDPGKIIKGSEIDAEYSAIATAIQSKADTASPTFTGTPSLPSGTTGVTQAAGTDSTLLATTAFVNDERTNTATLTNKTISGSSNTITNVSLSTGVTGTLPVANGGTGTTSLTANNVLLGNGTSAVQVVAPSTSGNVLTSNGTTWTSAAISVPTPTATYSTTTVSENASYNVPSGCIALFGYLTTSFGGNTGGQGEISLYTSTGGGGSKIGDYTIGCSSGNDGGSGSNWNLGAAFAIPSNCQSIKLTRQSGGNGVTLYIRGYITV